MANNWPERTADDTMLDVDRVWKIENGYPVPRLSLPCPICAVGTGIVPAMALRTWRFFERKGATIPYRCDVSLKCVVCSHVAWFGVPITRDVYRQHRPGRTVGWRQARRDIEGTE